MLLNTLLAYCIRQYKTQIHYEEIHIPRQLISERSDRGKYYIIGIKLFFENKRSYQISIGKKVFLIDVQHYKENTNQYKINKSEGIA